MHTVTPQLLASIAALPRRSHTAVMRELARQEFRRCREDILYWLDESRHPGVPYVFTHDKRQMFICTLCIAADERRREWTYGPHQLEHHCNFHHEELQLRSESEILAAFAPLEWKRSFTLKSYMPTLLRYLAHEQLFACEKSRDMIATWLMSAYVTWDAIFHSGHQNIVQSKTAPFTLELTRDRCWFMHQNQPRWLRACSPAKFTIGALKSGIMVFENGSEILGIPQGPDQIRQLHPNIIFMDEAAYQDKCGDAVSAAKPAVQGGGQIILLSSAQPSWFQLVCEDRSESE